MLETHTRTHTTTATTKISNWFTHQENLLFRESLAVLENMNQLHPVVNPHELFPGAGVSGLQPMLCPMFYITLYGYHF